MAESTPFETLYEAFAAVPINIALARTAFAQFEDELATLPIRDRLVQLEAVEEQITHGLERAILQRDTSVQDTLIVYLRGYQLSARVLKDD